MSFGFLVTSAINTRFGVYDNTARLYQTLDTIKSIKSRYPKAHITIIEMAGEPLRDDQKALLQEQVNMVFDFSQDPAVQEIYKNPNWDVVKSSTEMMCFHRSLEIVKTHQSYANITRFFKVSGRYLLNSQFTPSLYEQANVCDKIAFGSKRTSQFDPKITGGATLQYMSRCWSFPASELSAIIDQFSKMRKHMDLVVNNGGYIDIEHLLYVFTDPLKTVELGIVGVQGMLGPNGKLVRD